MHKHYDPLTAVALAATWHSSQVLGLGVQIPLYPYCSPLLLHKEGKAELNKAVLFSSPPERIALKNTYIPRLQFKA